jgi:hypothetical protein
MMNLDHEYAVLGGYNRSSVGRWLYAAAAGISAAVVFVLLALVDLAKLLDLNANLPPGVLSLVGAASVYGALYWVFDRYAWKLGPVGRILKVANLAGSWTCNGVSLERNPPVAWTGTLTIVQSWDRLRVHLETSQSSSDSIAAALLHDSAIGYRLLYHYRNNPRIGEVGLAAHHGFAELVFGTDGDTATGEYFNGRGRNTWGTMSLTKDAI